MFWVAAITAVSVSRLLTRMGTAEGRGGNRKSVARSEESYNVIMSTMASLINEGTFGTIRTIICWDQEDYIFHCSVPDEVSIRHYLSFPVLGCEHTRKWISGAGYWHRLVARVISSQSSSNVTKWVTLLVMLVTSQVTVTRNLSQLKQFACSGLPHLMSLGACHVCHKWHVTR